MAPKRHRTKRISKLSVVYQRLLPSANTAPTGKQIVRRDDKSVVSFAVSSNTDEAMDRMRKIAETAHPGDKITIRINGKHYAEYTA